MLSTRLVLSVNVQLKEPTLRKGKGFVFSIYRLLLGSLAQVLTYSFCFFGEGLIGVVLGVNHGTPPRGIAG
jgi:hypothetical protein